MLQRMGELLVEHGELEQDQLDSILSEQQRDYRPFGKIARERFDVHETAIWRAWAAQYANFCARVDLDREWSDVRVADLLSPEECWTFRLLPLRMQDGDIVLVTTEGALATALRFADERLGEAAIVWLAEPKQVHAALTDRFGQPPRHASPAADTSPRDVPLNSGSF